MIYMAHKVGLACHTSRKILECLRKELKTSI
jgi:hypothetical protein